MGRNPLGPRNASVRAGVASPASRSAPATVHSSRFPATARAPRAADLASGKQPPLPWKGDQNRLCESQPLSMEESASRHIPGSPVADVRPGPAHPEPGVARLPSSTPASPGLWAYGAAFPGVYLQGGGRGPNPLAFSGGLLNRGLATSRGSMSVAHPWDGRG